MKLSSVHPTRRIAQPRALDLNRHVVYIHSKFLLVDPLGDDPIVVTGSANFSEASLVQNDENMLIIRGDKRTVDIYFTEFFRIFDHYYFRYIAKKIAEAHAETGTKGSARPPARAGAGSGERNPAFLVSDLARYPWADDYYNVSDYSYKKLNLFRTMKGCENLDAG